MSIFLAVILSLCIVFWIYSAYSGIRNTIIKKQGVLSLILTVFLVAVLLSGYILPTYYMMQAKDDYKDVMYEYRILEEKYNLLKEEKENIETKSEKLETKLKKEKSYTKLEKIDTYKITAYNGDGSMQEGGKYGNKNNRLKEGDIAITRNDKKLKNAKMVYFRDKNGKLQSYKPADVFAKSKTGNKIDVYIEGASQQDLAEHGVYYTEVYVEKEV